MIDDSTASVYAAIGELCESLTHGLFPQEPRNAIAVRTLKAKAYEILLKKSDKLSAIKEEPIDPLRELDVRKFELRIEARNNSEKHTACKALTECLEFVESEPFFETDEGKAILTFLIAIGGSTTDEHPDFSQEANLLIPGPFTLYANYKNALNYPQPIHSTTVLATTFKSFHILKDYNNPYIPRFVFHGESKKLPQIESEFSLMSTKMAAPSSSLTVTKSQETWRSPLSINPSFYRFFNQSLNSTFSSGKTVNSKKIPSTCLPSKLSKETIVDSTDNIQRTFSWNWESLGHTIPLAPHFISEANASLHLHGVLNNSLGISVESKVVQTDRFLIDIKDLTVGIQSDSFVHDELMIFRMVPKITVPDISPSIMDKFVLDFLECGSCYKRLQTMTTKKNYRFLFDGFIFKASCGAIDEYLVKFRQFVVLYEDSTLLQYYKRIKKMMKQLSCLAHTLAIHPDVDINVRPPMGSQFLGYLYKEITHTTQKDLVMLLVYILKRCCHVYFKHLQKWLFFGVLDDPCNELFISFVDHYRPNTKYFFDKAYFVRKESVPGFFQGFEDQILQCGKYTMLLKAFNPTHPLFAIDYPSISVCLSFDEIQNMEENCHNYIEKVKEVCGKPITARDVFQKRSEEKKQFLYMVSEKSRRNLERWKIERENYAAQETSRKKKRLEELQAHLKEVRDRKLAEKKTELALDMKLLKEGQDREDKRLIQENVDIKKRIEYYQQLSDIIEERKHGAEIKVTSSHARIEINPGTPVSTTTEFESCVEDNDLDDDDDEDEGKSVYEDACVSSEFLDKFIETEKELNEIMKESENNYNPVIKRSASDLLNSNDLIMSEFQRNKTRVLGSTISDCFGCKLPSQSKTETKPPLTDAQLIKIKVLTAEFGTDMNSNPTNEQQVVTEDPQSTKIPIMSDLEINRKKMMQNDTFAEFNKDIERPLHLDLNTELCRNRKRVLDSEYNILTGASNSVLSTPMSTTSDSPMSDEHHEDLKNANVLKLDVIVAQLNNMKTPEMDVATAVIENTPECALNTAGIMSKKGFEFASVKHNKSNLILDLNASQTMLRSFSIINNSPYERCEELIKSNFKCKPMLEVFVLKMDNKEKELTKIKKKTVTDLSVVTLTEFLQKSVIIPLSAHLEVMNCEIMRIYLQDLDIMGHFKSLRNYFFLMDGEFGSFVCDGLISKLEGGAQPNELLNYHMLHTILDNALGSSISGNDKNAENLSFIVAEMPEKFDLASSAVLSSLSLSYRVTWPVNLILNPETLDKYSNIFKYLIKVRRISWLLEESYQMLKEIVKKNGKVMLLSPQYRSVQQIRHKFYHFIHSLKNHITSSALQASWKTLKDDLVSAKSIEDIYRKHTNYVKRVLFLCMLNKRSIEFYNTIENIFKVTLRFNRNLKSREWKRKPGDEFYTHSRYDRLLSDEAEFEKFIKYTIYLGNKIVRHGYQEEIGEFINLINFNHYYLIDV